jgi:hypothetical protein
MRAPWLLCAMALAFVPAERAEAPFRTAVPPWGAGTGPAQRVPSLSAAVAGARRIGRLRCRRGAATVAFAHLELFAHGRVVLVPAGIGLAPPRRTDGAYIRGAACRYPVATTEPTGLLSLTRGDLVLDDLFAVWGQPLSRSRLGRWHAPVIAHVDGHRWRRDPGAIPLRDHAQIVLQAGLPRAVPHAGYAFPPPR